MIQNENAITSAPSKGGLRIAHVSDLHILDLKGVRPWAFLNKRVTGAINLLIKRKKAHSTAAVVRAFEQIHALSPDHIVVTGDLTNLSLDSEYEAARRVISEHAGGPELVSVIPGNHDTYTKSAARKKRFEHYFRPWMQSDLDNEDDYPYVKLLAEKIALVGISTCVPTPPLVATGEVGADQRRRLRSVLSRPELEGRIIIVAQHHHLVPPKHTSAKHEQSHNLIDHSEVMTVLLDGGVDMVIHGHNHQRGFTSHLRPDGGHMFVCEAGSTSLVGNSDPHFGAKFNIYDLEPDNEGTLHLARVTSHLYKNDDVGFEPWIQEDAPFENCRSSNDPLE